jgi:tight adherence protein C
MIRSVALDAFAALALAAFAASIVWSRTFVPPLGRRLDPYLDGLAGSGVGGSYRRAPRRAIAARLGGILDPRADAELARKLRQAAVLADVPAALRGDVYRSRVLLTTAGGAAAGLAVAALAGRSPALALAFTGLGGAAGLTFWRGRLDRAVQERRAAMRIELYTVNQILAMHIRVGSNVVAAVGRLARRGSGEIAGELREVLALHRSGLPAAEAFRRIAAATPEPHARRTYHALATADERGTDVAGALLALSEDVRDGRRDAIRRRATRRRAVMLIPILGLLAPVLILFVAAPLPWLVLRGFG